MILREVHTDPGITQREIQGQVGSAWGTVNYHVNQLLRKGHIKAYRMQPCNHLFSPEIPDEVLPAIAALRRGEAPKLMDALHAPKQLGELGGELNLGKNVVRAHLSRLHETGLVQAIGPGRPKYQRNDHFFAKVGAFFRSRREYHEK